MDVCPSATLAATVFVDAVARAHAKAIMRSLLSDHLDLASCQEMMDFGWNSLLQLDHAISHPIPSGLQRCGLVG